MSREYNPIINSLKKETTFINDVKKASVKFFEKGKLETLYQSDNREVKAYRDDKENLIYVFDKNKNKLTINVEKIYDFNKDSSIKEILHWQYKEDKKNKGVLRDDLYMSQILDFNIEESAVLSLKADDDLTFLEKITNIKIDSISELMAAIKLGKKGVNNSSSLISCSTDMADLQAYTDLLHEKAYNHTKYSNEFFHNLTIDAFSQYQKFIPDWVIGMNGMIDACDNEKHTTYDTAFEYNDLDNHVWIEDKNTLVVTSQNVGFYFKLEDSNNFTVYFLQKEYRDVEEEIKRINNSLNDGTIHPLKDVALTVKNGTITSLNYSLMYCFELDMQFSVQAMKDEGIFNHKYPVDITSYEYQKNYYYHKFGMNEFNFIAQAMMTLGGGFDYDKKNGIFVDSSVKYIPNLPVAEDTRNETITKFSYFYPKEISYLNKDWLNALKYAVEVLKRDNPTPVVMKSKDKEKEFKEAITTYEKIIEKLESKKNKKNLK